MKGARITREARKKKVVDEKGKVNMNDLDSFAHGTRFCTLHEISQ
jgi:hypothetical protein